MTGIVMHLVGDLLTVEMRWKPLKNTIIKKYILGDDIYEFLSIRIS